MSPKLGIPVVPITYSTDTSTIIACTDDACHLTVQSLAVTLFVPWTPVTPQYRHWHLTLLVLWTPVTLQYRCQHLHCLYCEHLSLHNKDTGTYVACTVNTCHFTVQTLAPTLLLLRMPVTSLYQQWHHHSLYWGYVSLHSTNTGTVIACTEDICHFTVPALTLPFLFHDIRNVNNSAHEFQMCLLYVI